MRKTLRHPISLAAIAAALALGSAGIARADETASTDAAAATAMPTATSREAVKAELANAREAHMLPAQGELGDSPQVIAAREQFNEQQRRELVAMYEVQAEEARVAALQAQPQDDEAVPADDQMAADESSEPAAATEPVAILLSDDGQTAVLVPVGFVVIDGE